MGSCAHYCHLPDNNTNNNITEYSNLCNLIKTNSVIAKSDSGAISTYWREEDKHSLSNISLIAYQEDTFPNDTKVISMEGGIIDLSETFSLNSQKATITPDLKRFFAHLVKSISR